MTTIAQALTTTQQQLVTSDTSRLDAELLVAFAIGRDRAYLFTWPERHLSAVQEMQLTQLVNRRVQGEPIAYITGKREFWSLNLDVNATTLIPRPETELLVELALRSLPVSDCKIIDLGTGTGAIALALAKERPLWNIVACDKTEEIVNLAKRNAQSLGLGKITFVVSDWFENISDKNFDMVISNPPYIDSSDPHLVQGDVRFEPQSALVSEKNGLADIVSISRQALSRLYVGGWLMLEHGFTQGVQVRDALSCDGYGHVETFCDLAGHERVTMGRKLA